MKKIIIFGIFLLSINSCTSISKTEPTFAYKQQMENLEQEIYFRAVGNEPEWSLKISKNKIEFTSLKLGFETFVGPHVNPIRAMDANVKMYRVATESGTMNIQIQQLECINTMSGDIAPYSVRIEIAKGKADAITTFNGCGSYNADPRLHDIWVLEKMNGRKVSLADFDTEVPNFEINTNTNQFMGFAGCNRMNGFVFFEYELLRFANTITTRMACRPNNKENEFLKALQSTTSYTIENLRLTLKNQSGVELVFKKVD